MKKSILLVAVLMALVSLCLVLASCDSGSSDSSDPTPPPEPAPVTYTVSFDANGGTGTMDDAIVEKGVAYTVPTNEFAAPKIPVGAVNGDADIPFAGWNTAANGSGKKYEAEGTIPKEDITADITLYAQWTKPLFTVGKGDDDTAGTDDDEKVYFSKGNLQATYTGSAYTWGFAANQYSYVGDAAGNTSIDSQINGVVVDLFGWSTGTTTYGISTSDPSSDYYGDFKDWGENAISNGGNVANTWRTLSCAEWEYLLDTRIVNGGSGDGKSYSLNITYGDKMGMVLYPDNYTGSVLSGTVSSLPDGVVFLPAAGYRDGSSVSGVGDYGDYWSSTPYGSYSDYAYYLNFDSSNANSSYYYRNNGQSVRLVWLVSNLLFLPHTNTPDLPASLVCRRQMAGE